MSINLKKDITKIIRAELDDYVAEKCVPKTSQNITNLCNKGHATGRLAESVYYDKTGDMEYTVYVEAFNDSRTNYAVFADQGRGAIARPRTAKIMVFSDPHCAGIKAKSVGPAEGAHFIEQTIKDLKH